MNKNPLNKKNQRHGYWVHYADLECKDLQFKGSFFNNKQIGYWEWHTFNHIINKRELSFKQFFII